MSPTLLLKEERFILRPVTQEYSRMRGAESLRRESESLRSDTDRKTGIQFRCRCLNEDGRHDANCIYNLV